MIKIKYILEICLDQTQKTTRWRRPQEKTQTNSPGRQPIQSKKNDTDLFVLLPVLVPTSLPTFVGRRQHWVTLWVAMAYGQMQLL